MKANEHLMEISWSLVSNESNPDQFEVCIKASDQF
jgi:hypothetical protein